ncbi:g10297 [Coccomyxa elongata]
MQRPQRTRALKSHIALYHWCCDKQIPTVAMESLTPIYIKSWADEVDEEEYDSHACPYGEVAICQTGVPTGHVEELKALAAALLEGSSEATKQQKGKTEDGNDSPCCVLSCQASAVNSRSSTAPSSPRGQTDVCSTGSASVPRHLQAPAAQPTTARERLQEAMRKYGFSCAPSELSRQASAVNSRSSTAPSSPRGQTQTWECAADAQVSIGSFASRDCRIHGKPVDTIKDAARVLQQAHDANSARPATSHPTPVCPGSSCRSAGGVSTPPTSIPAPAQHQPQKGCPTGRLPRTSERGESAHESGARSAVPRQRTEHDIPRSTIKNRPARRTSVAATAKPSMPGGLRMLQQIVRASAAERGCPPSRRGQPARQQQQQQEALSAKAAHPQSMPPLPCAADPAQLHEQFATAPSVEPLPEDAEASHAVAAKPAEQQEETSCPSSSQGAGCMPAQLQFGTLAWDSSSHCAMEEQPLVPQLQPQVHMRPSTQCTAAGTPICFGTFTEQEAADLQLFKAAAQPTQQHMSPTAGNISVEAVPRSSSSGSATSKKSLPSCQLRLAAWRRFAAGGCFLRSCNCHSTWQ